MDSIGLEGPPHSSQSGVLLYYKYLTYSCDERLQVHAWYLHNCSALQLKGL